MEKDNLRALISAHEYGYRFGKTVEGVDSHPEVGSLFYWALELGIRLRQFENRKK